MLDPVLIEVLSRLDRRLRAACDAEELRATLLLRPGTSGWDGVRSMTEPTASELAFDANMHTDPLVGAVDHPLARARELLRLDDVATDVVVALLAPQLEARYQRLYEVLQDDVGEAFATERLLVSLIGRSPERRRALLAALQPGAPLRVSGFVVEFGEPRHPQGRRYRLAADVVAILQGLPPDVAVPQATWRPGVDVAPAARLDVIHGAGEHGAVLRELVGAAPVLQLALGEPSEELLRALWRVASLHRAWAHADLTALPAHGARESANLLAPLVASFGGAVAVATRDALGLAVPHHATRRLGFRERRAAWQARALLAGVHLDEAAAGRLASTWRFGAREIDAIFAAALEPTEEALFEAATLRHAVRIPHGRRVDARRTFDDIVLVQSTRQALGRLIFFVRNRDRVSESRGLEHRFRLQRGPVVLFSGLSGTGKTLAAEIVASTLRRPLFVVDLSRLVSKYIGETEKHIDEVLAAGERAGAVLFFDEADALFSARTEVSSSNDRFANLEVGYLLQRIEQHDGLVILATNLRQSIDEAFLRRFHTRVEFPMPAPPERAAIWRLMLPDAEHVDLDGVAEAHRLAGGDIRNAALKAIFLAEEAGEILEERHVHQAVQLELLEKGRLARVDPDATDQGRLLKRFSEALHDTVEARLREVFLKEVHVLHGAPTKEALAGKQPAVSLALHALARPRRGGVRLGFVVSVWSDRADEEHELLGVLHEHLCRGPITEVDGSPVQVRVQESHDVELLHRFWSSHGQPLRAAVVLDVELG